MEQDKAQRPVAGNLKRGKFDCHSKARSQTPVRSDRSRSDHGAPQQSMQEVCNQKAGGSSLDNPNGSPLPEEETDDADQPIGASSSQDNERSADAHGTTAFAIGDGAAKVAGLVNNLDLLNAEPTGHVVVPSGTKCG